jgi:hypothetical protein
MSDKRRENVKVEKRDGIAWVIMNRPDKRNAMSPQLHYEMDEALEELEVDNDAKVIVITGAGGNFSAGQDLKLFFRAMEKDAAGRKKSQAAANRWRWERLYQYDKPTIAMVQGYCVGGAFMQLLATDFAIAAEDATFSLSEVNWGILPGALVSKVVADMVLPRHALYYACLGEAFDGKLRGAEEEPGGQDRRACREADEEKPCGAARDQAGDPPREEHGFRAGLRLPRRQGPGHQDRRCRGLLQHRHAPVPGREELQADFRAVQAGHDDRGPAEAESEVAKRTIERCRRVRRRIAGEDDHVEIRPCRQRGADRVRTR